MASGKSSIANLSQGHDVISTLVLMHNLGAGVLTKTGVLLLTVLVIRDLKLLLQNYSAEIQELPQD